MSVILDCMTVRDVGMADVSDLVECWCCGQQQGPDLAVHLGNHPEVWVCLRCAHFLHRQARATEDALLSTPFARLRDRLRSARGWVMRRHWHQKPVIGPALRWLGRRLP
jgi:hypothetical protein